MSCSDVIEGRCFTGVVTERVRFVWKISNFSQRSDVFTSSVFPSSAHENTGKWYLQLYPNSNQNTYGQGTKSHISIMIYQQANVQIWATMKICVMDDKGSVAKSEVTHNEKFIQNSAKEFRSFIERDYVLNKDNCVLHNDEMTIVCEIDIRYWSENQYQEFIPAKFERPSCRLAEDLGNMLSSKSLADLTITVGGREFKAHKVILAARSPVFAAMFRNEMVEKEFSVVEITDVDPDVFQQMLEFIYTGDEITQTERTKELLAAANKYELGRLKFMCEEALSKTLSVDNVLENLALADLHNSPRLKEYAANFVMIHSCDVVQSSAWNNFKRSHNCLVMEIFEKICRLK